MIFVIRTKREAYAAISRQHKTFTKIIKRQEEQNSYTSYTGPTHSRRTENANIVKIYQRLKLSDTRNAYRTCE